MPVLVVAPRASDSQLFALACGIAAIVGHVFSVFVRFRGGKGVATAAGVMLGLTPLALGIAAAVWVAILTLTGYVSLASISAAAILPVAVHFLERLDHPGDPLARRAGGRGDHLVPSRQHPPPAQRNREPLRPPGRARGAPVTTIAVLGAGSWGTTLANLLACKGHEVRLWAYEPEVVETVNRDRENALFLPGVPLSAKVRAFGDAREAVAGAEVIVSAPPSHAVRSVVRALDGAIPPGTLVVSATKGIETDTLALMSEVFAECLPSVRFAVLSGPSFAAEVCQGQPTAVVAAAGDLETARAVQSVFATSAFRVYSNLDVVGVELAGALKNVIAVAAGIAEGLGIGHNPRAALITRGLAEITRLGVAMGADPLTFAGLAGMGDLVLTTTGSLSRNRALGVAHGGGPALRGLPRHAPQRRRGREHLARRRGAGPATRHRAADHRAGLRRAVRRTSRPARRSPS